MLVPLVAVAHEHWIDVDCFYPGVSQAVTVHLCSGHRFPRSSFALKEEVVASFTCRGPDGVTIPLVTTGDGKQRTGAFEPATRGDHVLSFVLKRPRAETPSFEGRAILVVGNQDDASCYATGRGLELVPEHPLADLVPGDVLPLSLRMDGRRIAGVLSVVPAGGKVSSLSTGAARPARAKLSQAGRYLVSATHAGRSCSLVFVVKEKAEVDATATQEDS